MKLEHTFVFPETLTELCIVCQEATPRQEMDGELTLYRCQNCGSLAERQLVFDPKVVAWIDAERTYWHETVGILIVDEEGYVLLFERILFPFQYTIVAGHLDTVHNVKGKSVGKEDILSAVIRESREEVGLNVTGAKRLTSEPVRGDSCRRGCDDHLWHLFIKYVLRTPLTVNDEGVRPVWLEPDEALERNLTVPSRRFIERYKGVF